MPGQAKPVFHDWRSHSRQAENDNTESEYDLIDESVPVITPVKKQRKSRKKKNINPNDIEKAAQTVKAIGLKKVVNEVEFYEQLSQKRNVFTSDQAQIHADDVHETDKPEREDDLSTVNGRSSKKCNGLILDEAEDEDDVYEDDGDTENGENYADQYSIINDLDEPGITARDIERSRTSKQITSQEIDDYLRERWSEYNGSSESDNNTTDTVDLPQELFLPTIK